VKLNKEKRRSGAGALLPRMDNKKRFWTIKLRRSRIGVPLPS